MKLLVYLHAIDKELLSHGAKCDMANIFWDYLISRIMRNEENICQYRSRQRAMNKLSLNAG